MGLIINPYRFDSPIVFVEDDMSSDNYTMTTSRVFIGSGVFNFSTSNSDDRGYRTIVNIGNTDFQIDWTEKIVTQPSGAAGHVWNPMVICQDNTRSYANDTNDAYSARTITKSGGDAVISPQQRIDGNMVEGSQSSSTLTQGSTYYMRLSLVSGTLRQEAFSDSDRTTSVAFDTITATAISNLVNCQTGSQTTSSVLNAGTITDLIGTTV